MAHSRRWGRLGLAVAGCILASGIGRAVPFETGVDLSYLPQIEAGGGVFRDGGVQGDAIRILRDHGANSIRLRLWHTPSAGWCNLTHTLAMAKRAKSLGMSLLLDIHYSDTWADPAQQTKPAAWSTLPFADLTTAVHDYTRDALVAFAAQNTVPDYVQIGNEITPGMLWPDGKLDNTPGQNFARLGTLLKAAGKGVRDGLPGVSTRIIVHVDSGGKNAVCRWFFDGITAQNVPFDVIGLSYYPWWQGSLSALKANLNDLASRYDKDVMVVETGYPWTLDWKDSQNNLVGSTSQLQAGYPATPDGQYRFLTSVIRAVMSVPDGRGVGVHYWAPDALSAPGFNSPWENVALFNFTGEVLPAADAFRVQNVALGLMTAGGLRGGTGDVRSAVAALRSAWGL